MDETAAVKIVAFGTGTRDNNGGIVGARMSSSRGDVDGAMFNVRWQLYGRVDANFHGRRRSVVATFRLGTFDVLSGR